MGSQEKPFKLLDVSYLIFGVAHHFAFGGVFAFGSVEC